MITRLCFAKRAALLFLVSLVPALWAGPGPGTNQPPVAVNDSLVATSGVATAVGVLANDYDPDGEAVSIFSFSQPAFGLVSQSATQLVYQSFSNYCGPDQFGYTITDGHGGFSNAIVNVTVVGCSTNATPISLTCSSNIVTTATGPGGAVVFYTVSANGGCSAPMVMANPPSGGTFAIGTTTVLATASDTCGNSTNCSFTITVNPPQYPPLVLNCSSNLTVTATSPSGATVFYTSAASGGCNPPPMVICNPPSGSTFPIGMTTVTCMASDSCGNSTNCSFTVMVNPPQYPPLVLNCSSNLTMTATSPSGATVFFTSSASGGCNPPPMVSCNPPSGSTFPIGTTTVTCTASDSCGQTTNCSFLVTVVRSNLPPILLTCSSNITVTATNPSGATVLYTSSASGGCSPPPMVICNPPSGSTFPIGTTTVICTASDACGTTTNCSFTVTVLQGGAPADLAVTKSASQSSINVGDLVTFTIVVSNGGPGSVMNAVVPESLGAGWSFLSVSNGPNASFDFVHQQWTILSLPPYASEMLALEAQATAPGWLTNRVDVLPPPGTPDPNPANNTSLLALLAVQAAQSADLKLTKTANTNLAEVTNAITFDVTVENLGPNDAKNITVKELPASYLYISGIPTASAGTGWDAVSRTWTITNLAANAKVTLQVAVLPLRGGAYTNTAAILASQPGDPNLNNNTSSVPVTFIGYAACGLASLCTLGGPPSANAKVTLIPPKGLLTAGSFTTTTDARGAFCLTNLLPGTYSLKVEPADPTTGIGTYQKDVVVGPETGFLNPWLPWPIITGKVTFGSGGPPYPNITVTATSADGKITQKANTDQTGTFTITGLADDTTYTVTATSPGGGLAAVPAKATVTVGAGGASCPAGTNFVLQGQLKISGRTRGCVANGPVVPYATVTLGTAQFPNLKTILSGSDGAYSFANLPPDTYTLTATHPTFTFNAKQVKLGAVSVSADLVGTQGTSVGGRVLDRSRAPLAGVEVVLIGPLLQNQQKTTTDATGVFVFNNLAAGQYIAVPTPPQQNFAFNPPRYALFVGVPQACQSYVIFIGNLNAVEVVALEVVQVCQDWQNNLPLVAGKPTLVRAFLKPAGTNAGPVNVANAKLLVDNGTKTTTLTPRWPIAATPNYAAQRNNPKTSLAFDVPTAWAAGQVTFTLQWPGGLLTTYTDPAGQQTAVRNNATTVQFQKMPALPIKWVLVNWTFGAAKGKGIDAMLTTQRRRLLTALPTVSIPSGQNNTTTVDWEPPTDPTNVQGKDEEEKLLNNLQAKLARLRRDSEFAPDRSKTLYHGILTGTQLGGQAGDIPGKTSFSETTTDPKSANKNTPSHELGHVLGRHHDVHSAYGITVKATWQLKTGACGEDALLTAPDYPMDQFLTTALAPTLGPMQQGDYHYVYGWDSSDQTWISTFGTADLMSYCKWTTAWTWPGSYTYTNLVAALLRRFGPVVPLGGIVKDGAVPCWLISGQVEMTSNTLSLDPLLAVLRPEVPTPPDPGPYTLLLLDRGSNALASVPFAPTVPVIEPGESSTLLYAYFAFDVPQVTGLAAAQILYQGTPLVSRTASPHPPTVQFTSPAPGAVLATDPIAVTWSGFDPDGTPLTYLLEYSADGGTNWETVALDLATNEWDLASETLAGSTNAFFRVTACDGMNEASALTGPVVVPDHAPQVEIVNPAPGDTLAGDEPVILRASAWDMEDGELAPTQFQWTDNLNGSLGTGDELDLDPAQLSEGSHLLTVTATDSVGHQSTASVPITVRREIPVPLSATLVGDQLELSWPVWAANLTVWATFSLDSPNWFLVDGQPVASGDNLVLDVPLLGDALFFRLAEF